MTNGEKIQTILDIDKDCTEVYGKNGVMTFSVPQDWWEAEYKEPITENCIACKYDETEEEDGVHCKKCLEGDSQFELDNEFIEPTNESDLAQDRYQDLVEYFGDEIVAKTILEDRKEFKAWLERLRWNVKRADELARELEQIKETTKNDLTVDCISREQAKVAIRDKFKDLPSRVEINTILNELPSVTPTSRESVDCIDRQATLDAIIKRLGIKNETYLLEAERAIYQQILAMPSVTPQLSSELEKNSKKLEKDFGELDCISRQAVLEQAYAYGNGLEPDGYCVNVEDIQALPSVIPQPCEDAVSRQEVLDLIADYDLSMGQVVRGIHALPSVTPQEPRWIPVSERLPEFEYGESDSVLVCFENETQDVLYFNGGNWCYPTGETYISVNHKNGWHNKVVVWMPLPKPYESQESKENENIN